MDWKLDDDKKMITVTFPTEPPTFYKLNTSIVDDLIRSVGRLRSHMLPQHRYEDAGPKIVDTIINPRWAVECEVLSGDILLHIHDPRYGTLSFLLPREGAGKLGQNLVGLASAPLPAPPSGKAS